MVERYFFTKRFKELMRKSLEDKYGKRFKYKSEKDLAPSGIKAPVDLILSGQNEMYLIEYEIHRADPSNNIAKISYWLHNEKPEQKITVIQVFTPHYISMSGKKNAKAVLVEYLGRELIEKQYDKRYRPIYSKSLNRSDFEELYKSFSCSMKEDARAVVKLKLCTQDIISQIEIII